MRATRIEREADRVIREALTIACVACGHSLAAHTPPPPGRVPPCYLPGCDCRALMLPAEGVHLP